MKFTAIMGPWTTEDGQKVQQTSWRAMGVIALNTDSTGDHKLPNVFCHVWPPEMLLQELENPVGAWMAGELRRMSPQQEFRSG